MKRAHPICTIIALLVIASCAAAAGGTGWHADLPSALEAAAESGRPVLVEFHSVGCGPCARMEHETLGNPDVARTIEERFEAVRVDAVKHPELATKYLVSFYPTIKFTDAEGAVVHDTQGFVPPGEFREVMEQALEAHAALSRARAAAAGDVEEARDALAIARDFHTARQYQQAARWAREASARANDAGAVKAEAQYVLGAALVDSGEPARAVQPLVNALKIAGGAKWQWAARAKLGYAWLQRGEEDSGIGMLQTVHASDEAPAELRSEAAELLAWWGVEVD
jgi:thioredoxin-related protein